ncbi:MAG: serine/threonine protein kinase [Verrucomicrobia bacterium]|nr:serine/threonine protein kinase [Verrucomicrobiota bacterium]
MAPCRACGAKSFVPATLAPFETVPCSKCQHPVMGPVKLRQFELIAPIASGGMGTVYYSVDTKLGREVAVKLMKQELAGDPAAVESFAREAKACAGLNHTNIIHIYTFDEWEGRPYLAMELADQGSLDDRINQQQGQQQTVPELEVLDVGIKVASALATGLKHNLTHRDIKPGNILFDADGEPKLVDFGLATSAEADTNHELVIYGTPYYLAPERILRELEDFHADMYSLGGTLYHAITGHAPFEAPEAQDIIAAHVHTPPTPPHEVVPEITELTSEALLKSLAKKPADRFASYDEFIMALTAARSHLLVSRYKGESETVMATKKGGLMKWFGRGT